jgi:sigma-E factor negative regulatory protein RseC
LTQDAIVTKVLPNHLAEVVVTRASACGSNCGSCESCIFQSELKAIAKNKINARPGQKVLIESKNTAVFSAALMVYIMPLVLFLIGYFVSYALGASTGICILVSFLCLVLSAFILVRSQKNIPDEKKITFDIIA